MRWVVASQSYGSIGAHRYHRNLAWLRSRGTVGSQNVTGQPKLRGNLALLRSRGPNFNEIVTRKANMHKLAVMVLLLVGVVSCGGGYSTNSDHVLSAIGTGIAAAANYPASNAVDGNTTTQWIANLTAVASNNNAWFQLDFGSSKTIHRVTWKAANGTPYPASAPAEYSIQVSDDASTWQTVATRTNVPDPAVNVHAIVNGDEPITAQGRYVRILTTKVNDGTGWALSFFEFSALGY
jgi:F5/8 type C domain